MEALLRCQVSHTVPKDRPQEHCTHVLFQPPTVAHISDRNGMLAEKHAQNLENKHHFFFLFSNTLPNICRYQSICVLISPQLNFHINQQSREMFWKWQMKTKMLKTAQAEFIVCIRWLGSLKHIHSPFFHTLKSFNMFNRAGVTGDIRLHSICLFIAQEAREWHTLVSFDCLMFFCFKMCLMTAMWACRNAFAALQWNMEPAKVVAKPPCATTLTGISHRPIISIRQAEWLQLHLPKC